MAVYIRGPEMNKKAASHACLRQGFKGHDIEQKHGDIPIRIFRLVYGQGFAPAFSASHTLRNTLGMLDRASHDKLLADNKNGSLEAKITLALAEQASVENGSTSGTALRDST